MAPKRRSGRRLYDWSVCLAPKTDPEPSSGARHTDPSVKRRLNPPVREIPPIDRGSGRVGRDSSA